MRSADEAALQAVMDAFAGYSGFAMETTAKRRAEPTGDLFSILVNAEVDGQRMSDDEIVFETLLILIGGDETTRHTLSGGTEQLLRHHDQWERLVADDTLVPGAVEEMLRWTSPVKNMARTIMRDNEFHGDAAARGREDAAAVRVGELRRVGVRGSGELPDRSKSQQSPGLRLRHPLLPGQSAGSPGAHHDDATRCSQRLPDLRLADDSALPLRPANFVSGLEQMPVVFTPSAPVLV